jgi:hypothetical protein
MNRSISLGILLGFATIVGTAFYGGGANASTSSLDHEQLQFISSTPASRVGGDDTSRTGPEEQEPQRRTAPEEEGKDISPLLRPEEDQEDQEAVDQVQSPCPEGTVLGTKGVGGECVSPDSEGESGSFKAAPVAVSGNNVYIAWPTNETGKDEVMFRASTDGGATFADKINLSNTTDADSQDAEIAADGDEVIVSWWERNATSDEPVLRASVDNGLTFGPLLQLATNGTIGETTEGQEG